MDVYNPQKSASPSVPVDFYGLTGTQLSYIIANIGDRNNLITIIVKFYYDKHSTPTSEEYQEVPE